jgi:ADP-glucose pyrophosphorylase
MKFETTEEEDKKIKNFHKNCKKRNQSSILVAGSYIFTPTSMGVLIEYECPSCHEKLNVRGSDNW